ncbi:subtilisin-like protein protease SBT1.7 [Cinnamomum micranthum f. kanehirae]|uniref:Subtilisin-like protein protease SBT1.7 n=1 Tax=Cinnamomum micranthum f. kanehirae TaxID=337451 RepID=A0A3S3MZM6_9MAGN|nr:subtilisin-like protein protease SBT1.7 [Cinnamomum micranthum f. kanehirae]
MSLVFYSLHSMSPAMELLSHLSLLSFFLVSLLLMTPSYAGDEEHRRSYIIHMNKSAIPDPFAAHHSWYEWILSSLPESDGESPTHLYTYNHVMNGFSAVLSSSQLAQLERMPGHIATYPETYGQLHTTRTPHFLGLNRHVGLWPTAHFGDDMIIGIVDTGIWPESESFSDDGMPPVPARWKGACETGTEFNSSNCNRKLIGARSFSKGLKESGLNISTTGDYDSPRDFFGHGTHTSSTAAGSPARNADYFGYAPGTAIGIAPMARVAMYKVLFATDSLVSASTDVLAGMDQAIADGVDLMSLSLGFPEDHFYANPIALGAFAALEKGIFVSCSAGNSGPHAYTIHNGAPWITTVGAGTIDRDYAASVTLGNGSIAPFQGRSIFPESLYTSGSPLYYGHGNTSKETCDSYALDPKDVAGKFVFCSFGDVNSQMDEVSRSGAVGGIFATDSAQFLNPSDFYMPFVAVSLQDGEKVKEYIVTSSPASPATVDITFQLTVLGSKPAPQVADFSSRGPYQISPWILKPDILAPGVNILAAWAPNRGWQPIGNDYLVTDFALVSGTSMSSPHLVGIAALVRAVHPDWSPAAIRSALMTTAYLIDNTHGPILDMITGTSATPLDFGGGHVNPTKAMDPGLVYDIGVQDYLDFLCGLNYTSDQMMVITRKSNYTCTNPSLDLNYPSFMVILNNTNSTTTRFTRVLTNVEEGPAVYRAVVYAPTGMSVVVKPETLKFEGENSRQGFEMRVEIDMAKTDMVRIESDYIGNYGYLSWHEVGGKHVVRSPIVSAYGP